ncbi:MAG: hypothetical protein ABR511_12420 [Acidimicrobiales bacterium]
MDEVASSRWVSMATIVGALLVILVALQLAGAIYEGLFTYHANEPEGVATGDLLHRLGYPFSALGTSTLVFLVLGVVLLALAAYLEDAATDSQERLWSLGLVLGAISAVVLALGSLLAVRSNFHVYSENGRSVPTYVILRYITFLVGNLGTSVVAFYAAVQAMTLRERA